MIPALKLPSAIIIGTWWMHSIDIPAISDLNNNQNMGKVVTGLPRKGKEWKAV